jgi:2-hydroxy-3-oxopropionate reductase
MAARDFTPRGKARSHKKDLGIVLDLARRHGVAVPGTALVDQLFTALLARDRGDWDHTALISIIDDLSSPA